MRSVTNGVVRHWVINSLPAGCHQFHAGFGVGPSQATSIGCPGASRGSVRVPMFRYQTTLPQMSLTTMSGSPSWFQSAAVGAV